MADIDAQLICTASALSDGGKGIRFIIEHHGENQPAFVIRHNGVVYGYLNRCRHAPVELDWQEGLFFDSEHHYLICSMHGALYLPDSGYCISGPCRGKSLQPLSISEQDGAVYYLPPQKMP